jgi:hypothetical protein
LRKIECSGRRSFDDTFPVWRTQQRCLNTAGTPTQTQCDLLMYGENHMEKRAVDENMSDNDGNNEM